MSSEGFTLVKRSRVWRSAAWPDARGAPFVNSAAWLTTEHAPDEALRRLHEVEARFGRRPAERNAPRTLDLDLIAFGRCVCSSNRLELPHPRAAERGFVLGPICDLDPRWRHPTMQATAAELFVRAVVGRDATPISD